MPNWITNRITINTDGDDSMIEKILSQVKSEQSEFDFNKIVPMPEELRNTTAPTNILSDEEYAKTPSRGITQAMSDELKQKFGFDNWYDWAYQHWGTKWNADEVIINDNQIEFNTAWNCSEPIFIKLSEMFPNVNFEVEFSDEDFGYNVGKMKLFEGIIVDSFYPKGGSEEAYELALDIQGDNDYYTWDIFFEVNEDEKELNSFIKTMIGIAYKKEKVIDKDLPLIVLNEFLSLALEKEDYEFASEVRDAIKSKEIVVGNPN
jgi:hypothetical protein